MWHNQFGGVFKLVTRLIQNVFSSKDTDEKKKQKWKIFTQRNRKAEQVNHAAFEFTQ